MMGELTNAESCDRLLDALNHRYRRRLLMALSEHNPQPIEGHLDAGTMLEPAAGLESDEMTTQIENVHKHLPKLVNYGYISLDETTNQISKGENFEEVEPLLTLLLSHEDELGVTWL